MEITKDKVTELFCIIDEFYKVFDAENAGKLLLGEDGVKRRRRKASLSDSEIMTILLYFHFGSFRNFKHYYLFFTRSKCAYRSNCQCTHKQRAKILSFHTVIIYKVIRFS